MHFSSLEVTANYIFNFYLLYFYFVFIAMHIIDHYLFTFYSLPPICQFSFSFNVQDIKLQLTVYLTHFSPIFRQLRDSCCIHVV